MANIKRYDPFAELQALQKQLFNDSWLAMPSMTQAMPTTDVYTEDNKMVVEAHLPHYDEKDITIDIDNGLLEIQGKRHEKVEDKDKQYVVRESSSSFYRSVRLPEQADESKVEATLDNGVLKVTVPFMKLPAPKQVAIKPGAKQLKKEK